MKITSFVNQLKTKNFDFVKKIDPHGTHDDYLKDLIRRYQERYNSKLLPIIQQFSQDNSSKTEVIIAIYNFIKHNRGELIEIYKYASRQLSLETPEKAHYQAIKDDVFKLLQQGRKFNYWAESFIVKESFECKAHLLSRDISEQEKSKARPYAEDNLDVTRDVHALLNQQGLALPDRVQKEFLDPQHRAWGTLYPTTKAALEPIHDAWEKQQPKCEDLTVEIEFDETKKSQAVIKNYYFSYEEALYCMLTTNNQNELCLSGTTQPFSSGTRYIYSMDIEGNLFVHPDDEYKEGKRIGHPAFTRGNAVACAGEITVKDGKITEITNGSGHYRPGPFCLYRAVKALYDRNVLASNCIIQDLRGDFFIEKEEIDSFDNSTKKRKTSRLTWEQYSACYSEKTKSSPSIPTMNLSEKPNPLPIIQGLRAIHQYVHDLGKATCLLSKTKGKDYYERRNSFKKVLEALSSGDYKLIFDCIDTQCIKFQNTSVRDNYVTLLIELKTHLVNSRRYSIDILDNQYLARKIQSYYTMYQQLDKCTDASRTYTEKHSFFSSNNELRANQVEAINSFKFQRQEIDKEFRKEFAKPDEVAQMESTNSYYF
ncbi:hypothetical protein [Legionella sp. WA2024007413]